MKKIIFGIVALLIATFGLYAFTHVNTDEQIIAVEEMQSPENLHWFPVDPITGNPVPQDTEPPKVSIENSGCPNGDGEVCKMGYTATNQNSAGKYIPDGQYRQTARGFEED